MTLHRFRFLTFFMFAVLTVLSNSVFAQESNNAKTTEDVENIEVKGQKLDELSNNVMEYHLNQELGLNALHAKNFETAFTRLTQSAKQGNKLSQFYLASMYFKGQGTEINNKMGWIWLNLATEQKVPDWNFAYTKIKRALPESAQEAWADEVESYRSRYGAEATDHICKQRRKIGSNLKFVICERMTDGTYEYSQWRSIQALFFEVN